MKVPNAPVGDTRPSSQGLDYFRVDSEAGFGPWKRVGAAIAGLGDSFQALAETNKANVNKTKRFDALRNMSDFETNVNAKLIDLKQNTPYNTTNYVDQASTLYDNEANKFISEQVAPELQSEFRARVAETKQAHMLDSMKFQYEQNNAYWKTGVDDVYQKSLNTLSSSSSVDDLNAARKQTWDQIDASGMSADEKITAKRNTSLGLAARVYQNQIHAKKLESMNAGPQGSTVDKIINIESGGNPNAKNLHSTATGLGQFTEGTWLDTIRNHEPDLAQGKSRAELLALRKDPTTSRRVLGYLTQDNQEALGRAGFQPTEGNTYLAHFLGQGGAVKLLGSDPGASAISVLGEGVIRANPNLRGMNVAQVKAWADAKMSGTAPAPADYSSIDSNPAFANIPLEDRLNAQQDGEKRATSEYNDTKVAAAAAHNTTVNDLYLGVESGKYGMDKIDEMTQAGVIDYGERARAEGIYKDRNENGLLVQETVDRVRQGPAVTWNPQDERQNKGLNALYSQSKGDDNLNAMNMSYVDNTASPLIQQTQIFPSDMAGQLSGMLRSSNDQKRMFALDALSRIHAQAPRAFAQRISGQDAQDVAHYEDRQGLYSQEELAAQLREPATPQERQARQQLEEEGKKILNDVSRKDYINPADQVTKFLGELDTHFIGFSVGAKTQPPMLPWMQAALQHDYSTYFLDELVKRGNAAEAATAARADLHRDWGQTTIGGQPSVMKMPPENYTPALGGDHQWVDDQARNELHIPDDANFQLLSDNQTRDQLTKWQRDPNSQPPSWQVVIHGADGIPRMATRQDVWLKSKDQFVDETTKILGLSPQEQALYKAHLDLLAAGGKSAIAVVDHEGKSYIVPNVEKSDWANAPSYPTRAEAETRATALDGYMQADRNRAAAAFGPDGTMPYRIYFLPPAALIAHDEQKKRADNASGVLMDYSATVYTPAEIMNGGKAPPDIEAERNRLAKAAQDAAKQEETLRKTAYPRQYYTGPHRPVPGPPTFIPTLPDPVTERDWQRTEEDMRRFQGGEGPAGLGGGAGNDRLMAAGDDPLNAIDDILSRYTHGEIGAAETRALVRKIGPGWDIPSGALRGNNSIIDIQHPDGRIRGFQTKRDTPSPRRG